MRVEQPFAGHLVVEQDGVQRFRRAVAGLVGPPAYGVVDLQGTCKKAPAAVRVGVFGREMRGAECSRVFLKCM